MYDVLGTYPILFNKRKNDLFQSDMNLHLCGF